LITERTGIDVTELATWRQSDTPPVVIDVREAWELDICALPGALHIALNDLPRRLGDVPTDQPVVLMCHHGGRSEHARRWLAQNGVTNALNLEGGIDAWSIAVDNTLARY
jgi:rhodanese-related sulfurtransferase